MLDPFYLQILEGLFGMVTIGLMWQLWNLNSAAKRTADNAAAAKQNAWDNAQVLKEMQIELSRLREEHKEIQGNQERAENGLNKFAEAVSNDVRTIMRDHGEHEVGQAKIESKLDELIRNK